MKELCTADVLVVGGGPAGIGAALGAARAGARTMLVERYGFLGGVASWCLGMPVNQIRPGGRPRSKVHELLVGKLLAGGDRAVRMGRHELNCNVDYLKVAVLDTLDEAGCGYLVHVFAADALVENGRVTGVVAATKAGLAAIRAKIVVDSTGDADVAFFAGAETMKETGNLSPGTLCLGVGGIPPGRAAFAPETARRARGKYPLIPEGWELGTVAGGPGRYINHPGTRDLGQFDMTDPFELTRAEAASRRQAVQMMGAMREFGGKEMENAELTGTGPQIGVRETRRIKGLYVITEEDAKNGARFDDGVAWRSGFLDIGYVRYERMKVHDVPYRALVPEKVDGLLAAGRCISTTHVAASAGKSMGNCMAIGHAAGLAAAMCAAGGIQPRELDVRELRDALRRDGVDLERAGDIQEELV